MKASFTRVKTYLDESGLQILTDIMCKDIETSNDIIDRDEPEIEQIEITTDSSKIDDETLHINEESLLDKKSR